MGYSNTLPRTQNINGSDCTGSDGEVNRTYTIPDSGMLSEGISIDINGTALMSGDFTVSGTVFTFLNNVDDTDVIRINYFLVVVQPSDSILTTSTTLNYSTPLMLTNILGLTHDVPTWDVGATPTNEAVGTGDSSATQYFLDHQNVISDTYTLYANAVAMTETTDYTLDTDTGEITLTAAGVTLLSTNALTAKYKYIDTPALKTSYIITVLGRAEKEVDNLVNSTFTDGTATNPGYPVKTEIKPTEGLWTDRWITEEKPLKDITSTLLSDITDSDSTLAVASGDGDKFPTSGSIIIGSEVIAYTGISTDTFTGLTRGSLGTTAAAHTAADDIHTTIVFISDTTEGTDETFTIQPWDTNIFADADGLVYRYKDASPTALSRAGVANRIKIIYYYGYDAVPKDITRLTLLLAKRQLMQDNISKAIVAGRNEFRPEMMNADRIEIENIIGPYLVVPMENT